MRAIRQFMLLLLIVLPATTSGRVVAADLFSIHGSNTVGEKLSPALARAWLASLGANAIRQEQTSVENESWIVGTARDTGKPLRIFIAAHGSSTAFEALLDGRADIGQSSRPVKESEVEQLRSRHGDLRGPGAEHVIAIDGLAIIVHPSNPVDSLDKITVARLFAGDIRNWSELGGPNQPVRLYARDDKSGTWDTFKTLVLGTDWTLDSAASRHESSEELSMSVRADPGAIGFIGMAAIGNAKPVAMFDRGTPALRPEHLTVATEDYLLSRRLFMYTAEQPVNPHVQPFLDFVTGEAGQEIVKDIGYVSQNLIAYTSDVLDSTNPDYLRATTGNQRLSVNFRFREGSAALDNKAMKDLQRLVDFLQRPENRGRPVWLVGFNDAADSANYSRALSTLRALAVKSRLFDYGFNLQGVVGIGDDKPVADPGSTTSQLNSRVEVWVGPPALATVR